MGADGSSRRLIEIARWWPADYAGPPRLSLESEAGEALGISPGGRRRRPPWLPGLQPEPAGPDRLRELLGSWPSRLRHGARIKGVKKFSSKTSRRRSPRKSGRR